MGDLAVIVALWMPDDGMGPDDRPNGNSFVDSLNSSELGVVSVVGPLSDLRRKGVDTRRRRHIMSISADRRQCNGESSPVNP